MHSQQAFQTRPRPVDAMRWPLEDVGGRAAYDFIARHRGATDYMSGTGDARFYLTDGPPSYRRLAVVYPGCWLVADAMSIAVYSPEDFARNFERVA
jgi:hypothetical protein